MSRLPETTDTVDNLPIKVIRLDDSLYRVNSTEFKSPVFYSKASNNRWTPLEGEPGVCYFALSETGAIAETVCRNAAYLDEAEKSVSLESLSRLAMYEIVSGYRITLLDLTASNLARYRLDAGILADYAPGLTPPYQYCPAWASHAVSLGLDGILYRSRHAVDESCLALFEGSSARLAPARIATLDHPDYLAILEEEFDWAIN